MSLLATPAAAAVEARIALDRHVLEWRREHTLNLLVDFIPPVQPVACSPTEPATVPIDTDIRALNVRVEMQPAPIVRQVSAPGFPVMRRGVHTTVYAGAASTILLRLRVAPASTGDYELGTVRVEYEDPDTGEARTLEQALTVTMRLDAESPSEWYDADVAASDFVPHPLSEPGPRMGAGVGLDHRVIAQSARIMASFNREGRPPGNPADEVSLSSCLQANPFTIVLDPGHAPTGETRGRPGRKAAEAVFNDRAAEALAEELGKRAGLEVSVSRRGPKPLPMGKRIRQINEQKPDLVVSLHHDNVSPNRQRARQIGETIDRVCSEYEGFSIYAREESTWPSTSWTAGRFVANALLAEGRPVGRFFNAGESAMGVYDGKGLALLNGMKQPAILVELGYLCNPREKALVETDYFVRTQARALADAIERFVANTHCAP